MLFYFGGRLAQRTKPIDLSALRRDCL